MNSKYFDLAIIFELSIIIKYNYITIYLKDFISFIY